MIAEKMERCAADVTRTCLLAVLDDVMSPLMVTSSFIAAGVAV
jgi:hypothetical protein